MLRFFCQIYTSLVEIFPANKK